MKSILRSSLLSTLAVILFTAGSLPLRGAEITVALQEKRAWTFEEAGVTFDNQFEGARLNDCEQAGPGEFRITILPENAPINNSAWYAFRVKADAAQEITVRLAYQDGRHRYTPKIKRGHGKWRPLPNEAWQTGSKSREAVLELKVGPKPVYVAAQEMIGVDEIDAWMATSARKPFVARKTVGRSLEERPIDMLTIAESDSKNYVFIIGRQHPPEITGSLALMTFVDRILGEEEKAGAFRRAFTTIVIPMVNPDGVVHGHWRHNLAGKDLNRDWETFAQPETRAVRNAVMPLAEAAGARVFLWLDFHSTRKDVFYTQRDEVPMFPQEFTREWLKAIEERFPDYKLHRSPSLDTRALVSKGWAYKTFGAPAITYELGDHTKRPTLHRVTSGAAEEMMRLLVDEVATGE